MDVGFMQVNTFTHFLSTNTFPRTLLDYVAQHAGPAKKRMKKAKALQVLELSLLLCPQTQRACCFETANNPHELLKHSSALTQARGTNLLINQAFVHSSNAHKSC